MYYGAFDLIMNKDSFFKNSLILTLSNLTTGTLGFMFSIILSRELGAEGMGLYGLIMPIYNLFICLICGGIITAISKIGAEYFAKNDYRNLNKTVHTTLVFNIIWSIIVVTMVFIFAYPITVYIIKDPRTLNAVRLTCPAMIFIALSNTLKGYFYGTEKMSIPAFIDIFEKAVRICVLIAVVNLFHLKDVTQTVTAAYAALCIGEFISLIALYAYYKFDKKKRPYSLQKSESRVQLIFDILVISLPLCINGFISAALSTASTLIVPRRLQFGAQIEYGAALAMIGKFTGMSLSIVFFPLIVVGSMSTVLIPDLSQNISKKDFYAVQNRIKNVLKISFVLGLATLIICYCIPEQLGTLFFKRKDLGPYIRFVALSAPLFYVASTTYGIMNGLGKQNLILRNSLIVSITEVILLYILTGIPKINIYGVGICLLCTSLLTLILNIYEIRKSCEINISFIGIIIDLLVGLLVYFVLTIIMRFVPDSNFIIKNIIIIFLGFTLFFTLVMLLNPTPEY
jgi:stage V sporulation protein B